MNSKANTFSAIQADYLLQNDFKGTSVYLFLAHRSREETQVCRTFFPKTDKDYTQGQPRYTLLKKEKHNIITGEIVVQYDRLTRSNSCNKISLFEHAERANLQ